VAKKTAKKIAVSLAITGPEACASISSYQYGATIQIRTGFTQV